MSDWSYAFKMPVLPERPTPSTACEGLREMRNIQWFLGIVLAVDLTAAPLGGVLVPAKASAAAPAEGESVGSIQSDPARLARIRAAKMSKIIEL